MPIVGSFAGASARAYGLGAGVTALDGFFQIATTTVGVSAVSDITFSSIPATYKHLHIRGISIQSSGGGVDAGMQFNSDTGSNYSSHAIRGSGGAPSSQHISGQTTSVWIGANNTNNTSEFEIRVFDILDYANTNKYKTVKITHTSANNTSTEWLELISSNWRNTAAISTIKIFPIGANWSQHTTFSLYGITG